MLIGRTGGGKSTLTKVLMGANNYLREIVNHPDPIYQSTLISRLNPKSIKLGELYGETNILTNEWSDGLASKVRYCNYRFVLYHLTSYVSLSYYLTFIMQTLYSLSF